MGCGSSKSPIVAFKKQNHRPSSAPTATDQSIVDGDQSKSGAKQKKPSSALSWKKNQRPESGGTAVSVSAVVAFRNGSAASGASDRSIDSGIGGEIKDGNVVLGRTGLPPPGPRFNQQQLPSDLNQLKTETRPPPRPRVDEESILASLRQEGLLGAPNTSTTKGGLSFEVPAEELKVRSRRPPPRLQRLEPVQLASVTNDQVKQKLAAAENRRKKRENEKVQRNRDKDAKILEGKLASLDMDNLPDTTDESNQARIISAKSQGRIISARNRIRRPPSAVQVPAAQISTAEELDVMTPKASPLLIDEIPVGDFTDLIDLEDQCIQKLCTGTLLLL